MADVRNTGPVGLQGLKGINQQKEPTPIKIGGGFTLNIGSLPDYYNIGEDIPIYTNTRDLGSSKFDKKGGYTAEDIEDIENTRANQQSALGKWTNGIAKGVVLAGTTFLDSTIGLLYGIGKTAATWERGAGFANNISDIWDNEFSNGLQEINEWAESAMPNHRTAEERENKWYQNLGTANFWADTFLKNLGFTVGAYYSGAAFTKGLQGLKLLNSGLGAATAGATYSAINEARIEANHNANDFYKAEEAALQSEYQKIFKSIESNGLLDREQKNAQIEALNQKFQPLLDDLNTRKSKVGLTTLIGNSVFLAANDFITMGRLYAKGFNAARRSGKGVAKEADNLFASDNNIGKNLFKKEGKWAFDEITTGKAVGKGFTKAMLEGNEELAQKFMAGTAYEWNDVDSPDAYQLALLDDRAQVETDSFLNAAIKGFKDSYGNIDSYEEFAVGFLTGALGIPTFGRANNADASTYLGRGKTVGISGGLLGEISMARQANRDLQEATNFFNAYEQKLAENKEHFVRSEYFTNAMNGWAEANDAFEYKNLEDNDDFVAIARYASMGKLNHLKDLVNQDFNNLSDEVLLSIAQETSGNTGGWREVDGSFTPEGQEGINKMKAELTAKKEQTLKRIDEFEKAWSTVESISNQGLSKEQTTELAWYLWKINTFEDRYKSIINTAEGINTALTSLSNWENLLLEEREQLTEDKDGETLKDNTEQLKGIRVFKEFISVINNSRGNLARLSQVLKANKAILNYLKSEDFVTLQNLFADHSAMDMASYRETMSQLQDISRIATAYDAFNQRYEEFTKDPLKIQKNKEKLQKKAEVKKQVLDSDRKKTIVESLSNNELSRKLESGELSWEDLEEFREVEGLSEKIYEVEEMQNKRDAAVQELQERYQRGEISDELLADAEALINSAYEAAELPDQVLDTNLESMLNSDTLPESPSEASMLDFERQVDREERLDTARSLINEINEQQGSTTSKPSSTTPDTSKPDKTTGKDGPTKPEESNKKQLSVIEQKAWDIIQNNVPADKQQEVFNDFKDLLSKIEFFKAQDFTGPELKNAISRLASYEKIKNISSELEILLVEKIIRVTNNIPDPQPTVQQTKPSPVEASSNLTSDEVISYNDKVRKEYRSTPNSGTVNGIPQYWQPSTTRYPIHKQNGDSRPYYQVVKDTPSLKSRYTEAQLQRMEAVHKYLEQAGTFALRDSGGMQTGESVSFVIDPKLNEAAGDIVILMMDSQGRIIGDLVDETLDSAQKYPNLVKTASKIKEAYKNNSDTITEGTLWDSGIKSEVQQVMVGAVNYDELVHSLNEIFTTDTSNGSNSQSFTLGVVMPDMSISTTSESKAGNDPIASNAIRPLNLKAGQPVVLIPTGVKNRTHIAVPFAMAYYSPATANSTLGKLIDEVINSVTSVVDSNTAVAFKNRLEQHLGTRWSNDKGNTVSGFHVNIVYKETASNVELQSGIVIKTPFIEISYQKAKGESAVFRIEKPIGDPSLVTELKQQLISHQIPFRISRSLLNKTMANGMSYNSVIGELATTNITPGFTHAINTWFTIKPLDENSTPIKGKVIKTMGVNPPKVDSHSVSENTVTMTYLGKEAIVNLDRLTVTFEGIERAGLRANILIAKAWGIKNNLPVDSIYETPLGLFDSVNEKFVEQEPITKSQAETPKNPKDTDPSDVQLNEDSPFEGNVTSVRDRGEILQELSSILNTSKRKAIAATLSTEQLDKLSKLPDITRTQVLKSLEFYFDNKNKTFRKDVNSLLNPKNRKTSENVSQMDFDKEMTWLEKALPQYTDRVSLVKGLIKISESPNSERAWGQFYRGTITLSNIAASGTLYHEAFHAVVNTIMSENEVSQMFKEAQKRFGNKDEVSLEEDLAEEFRRYVQLEEGITGKIVKFYRKIKHFLQSFFGKENILDRIYYNINSGKYANIALRDSEIESSLSEQMLYLQDEMRDKDEFDEISEYHEVKNRFENLSIDDKVYVKASGIPIEKWNKMSPATRRAVLQCK